MILLTRAPRAVRFMETGSMVIAGPQGLLFSGHRAAVLQDRQGPRGGWRWWLHSNIKYTENGEDGRFYCYCATMKWKVRGKRQREQYGKYIEPGERLRSIPWLCPLSKLSHRIMLHFFRKREKRASVSNTIKDLPGKTRLKNTATTFGSKPRQQFLSRTL